MHALHDVSGAASVTVYGISNFPAYDAIGSLCEQAHWGGAAVETHFETLAPLLSCLARDAGCQAPGRGSEIMYLPERSRILCDLRDGWVVKRAFDMAIVAVMEKDNPLARKPSLEPRDLDGRLLNFSNTDYDGAFTFWNEMRDALREMGIRRRSVGYTFNNESDWAAGLNPGISLMSAHYCAVDTLRSYHKAVIPVEGLVRPYVAAYRGDDVLAAFVATLDVAGEMGER